MVSESPDNQSPRRQDSFPPKRALPSAANFMKAYRQAFIGVELLNPTQQADLSSEVTENPAEPSPAQSVLPESPVRSLNLEFDETNSTSQSLRKNEVCTAKIVGGMDVQFTLTQDVTIAYTSSDSGESIAITVTDTDSTHYSSDNYLKEDLANGVLTFLAELDLLKTSCVPAGTTYTYDDPEGEADVEERELGDSLSTVVTFKQELPFIVTSKDDGSFSFACDLFPDLELVRSYHFDLLVEEFIQALVAMLDSAPAEHAGSNSSPLASDYVQVETVSMANATSKPE